MGIHRTANGDIWAAYNPVPHHNGSAHKPHTGRTPFVLRKSCDNGRTWGPLYTLESDPDANYCYPSMLETKDGCLLVAYMSNHYDEAAAHDGNAYTEISLRMQKVRLDEGTDQ